MVNSRIRSRLMEARMAARECQIGLAESASTLGIWTLEPATGDLSWSPRCRTLLGAAADSENTFEALLTNVLSEDRAAVQNAFALATRLRREFTVEFRTQSNALVRCIGRPHVSATNPDDCALSGLVTACANASEGSRVGVLLNRLDRLREVERSSLATRLQAEVAQRLAMLQSQLESLAVSANVPATTRAELVALSATATECMDAVRGTIFEMSPPGIAELGFAGALERYAFEHAEAAGIRLSFDIPSDFAAIDTAGLESLFVAARAGIDNVVRHSRASNLRVAIARSEEELVLRIEDDGIGITNADLMKDNACSLFAASERLAQSGGDLRISGKPNQGTTLEANISLRQRIHSLRQNVTKMRVA